MKSLVSYRGLVNPIAAFPESAQRLALAPYAPTEIYVVGRDTLTLEDVVRQQRGSRVVLVQYAALAARQKGAKATRYASLLEFKDEIHARGGYIEEAATGLRSSHASEWRKMREEADRMLGRITQGAKSALNGRRGTPPHDYTKETLAVMLLIKLDRKHYPNWPARQRGMKTYGIDPIPGRTWFTEKLDIVARNLGLLK